MQDLGDGTLQLVDTGKIDYDFSWFDQITLDEDCFVHV